MRKTIVVSGLIAILLLAFSYFETSGVFNRQRTLPTTANIKSIKIGVFWDPELTNMTNSVNWGMLEPGENKTILLYLENQANVVVTYSMYTSNWIPDNATDFIVLSWDYEGSEIVADEVIPVNFTLAISPLIVNITSFSFDVNLVSTG